MRLDVYVNYRGQCEAAFRFYQQHLGGRITGMVRHAEQPNPALPADWRDKVLHARIEIGGTVLMGADVPHAEPMRSAYLSLSLDREEEAERVYALLADGGEIFMKMEKTPFANRFAMLRDRFGTSWMLLHQTAATSGDTPSNGEVRERAVAILPGDDLGIAKDFYVGKLGFTVTFEATDGGRNGIMGLARGTIELTIDCPMSGHGRNACVSLRVNSADACYDEWRHVTAIRRPPVDEPWGGRTFSVHDPFGNTIFVIGPQATDR